jgi:hypothetical protein
MTDKNGAELQIGDYVEKIPLDEKEREQLIFLRSLEQ